MAHKVIPTGAVTRAFSHPAWQPQDEEGTASGSAGDAQQFHTVKGAAVKLGGESGFEEDYEDRTGDGDDGEVNGPTKFRRSFDRTLTWVSPASVNTWMQKFLQTVADDADRRPAKLIETFNNGNTNTTDFYVQKLVNTVEEKGVVMGSANLRVREPVTQARV